MPPCSCPLCHLVTQGLIALGSVSFHYSLDNLVLELPATGDLLEPLAFKHRSVWREGGMNAGTLDGLWEGDGWVTSERMYTHRPP